MTALTTVNLVTDHLGTINLLHSESDQHNPPTTYGYWLAPNHTLGGAPPLRFSERPRFGAPGSSITPLSHGPRDIVLPITVRVEDEEDLPDAIAELVRAVDPMASASGTSVNEITLEVVRTEAGASTYSIDGYVVAGLQQMRWRSNDSRSATLPLVVRCEEPYWRIGSETSESNTFNSTATWQVPLPTTQEVPIWPRIVITATSASAGTVDIDATSGYLGSAQDYQWTVDTTSAFTIYTDPTRRHETTDLSEITDPQNMFAISADAATGDMQITFNVSAGTGHTVDVYFQPLALSI